MTIEKEYPPPPTPKEIKLLQEIQRLRDLADSMGQDNIRYLQEIDGLQAYVKEWKMRYETARLAHEEGRAEIEQLTERGMEAEAWCEQLNDDNQRLKGEIESWKELVKQYERRIFTLEGMLGEANIAIPE
jgi:chromosome segregation ATPase